MEKNTLTNDVRSVASGVRLRVLIPLLVVLILLVLTFVAMFILEARKRQSEDIERTAASVEAMYRAQSDADVQTIRSVMELVMSDRRLAAALQAGDRKTLFDISEPILQEIRDKNRITHFYYILPDRTMLLRVQVPDAYGDTIDRFVLQEAQSTGKPFWGNKQGPFGSFTLRVACPWYENVEVIGYLERGIEFEDIMRSIKNFLDVDVFVAIDKKYFDRVKWESARKKKAQPVAWDEFPSVVVLSRTTPAIPAPIGAYIAGLQEKHMKSTFEVAWEGRIFQTVVSPFANLRGQELCETVALRDITAATGERRRGVVWVAALSTIITGLLDFARTKPPQIKTVTARELIAGSLGRCTFPENVELHDEVEQILPPLKIDQQQIGQVLQNLIMNGVQAMPAGGTITLRGRQDSEGRVHGCRHRRGDNPCEHEETLSTPLHHQTQGYRAGAGGLPQPHRGQRRTD